MPFTTWIRDALGIRKDIIDIKKSKLELERLETEKRERNLITPATLGDIKKYDPKVGLLIGIVGVIVIVAILVGLFIGLGKLMDSGGGRRFNPTKRGGHR